MADGEKKPKRDPLFSAAVLKLSFRLANNERTPAFKFVYDGVLRDLKVEDETVEKYLQEHYEAVLKAARGKERGEK
ncbi:MAG TPA: hypothetical protein VGK67_02810 [Myxococcales bacterium]|jgi:hypothetical protein